MKSKNIWSVGLCALLGVTRLVADTHTWTGGAAPDMSWGTAGNWDATPDFVAGDDIVLNNVTNGSVMTLDSDKTVGALTLGSSGNSYSISNSVLTLKSGIITRSKGYAAGVNEKIYSDIVLGTNGDFDITSLGGNNPSDGNLATFIYGVLSDGGGGFRIRKTGYAHLYFLGNCAYSGPTICERFTLGIFNTNATSAIIATNAGNVVIYGPCLSATNIFIGSGSSVSIAHSSHVANAILLFNGGTLSAPEATNIVLNNPIVVYSNFSLAGSCYITLTAPFNLDGDRTITFSTWHSQRYFALNGAIGDGAGGAHHIVVDAATATDSHMPAVATFNGTNTFTGGMLTRGAGRVVLNGEMGSGFLVVSNNGNTGHAGVEGACLFHFRTGDTMLVCTGKTMDARSMKFDLTGISLKSQTLVVYSNATFMAPDPFSNILTEASVKMRWQVTNDTDNSVVRANCLNFAGSILALR